MRRGWWVAILCWPGLCWAGTYVNHVGMSFVDIPAGSFLMGACKSAGGQKDGKAICHEVDVEAYEDETPQHRVTLHAFQMGRTPVTLAQFERFARDSGNAALLDERFRRANEGQGGLTPVVWVSWQDAQAFVEWLNRSKPKADTGTYRLPSEAEWEYAARGGTTTRYFFGDGAGHWLGLYAWYDKNAGNRQRVVGGKKPNAYGLHDMLGNVWEWTADCWNEDYRNAPAEGSAWQQGDCSRRVVRGGSWFDVPLYLRVTARFGDRAARRIGYDGFRVVRSLP
jgi:formylglycine-generating enzyme required for sulfatase activity